MSAIAAALRASQLTCRPIRAEEPTWELVQDGEVLATCAPPAVLVGGRRLTLGVARSQQQLVDDATGATVLSFTSLRSGPATIRTARQRYRIAREGLVPMVFQVTGDIGGPQVARIARIGGRLRFRAGSDVALASDQDLELIALAACAHLLGMASAATAAA